MTSVSLDTYSLDRFPLRVAHRSESAQLSDSQAKYVGQTIEHPASSDPQTYMRILQSHMPDQMDHLQGMIDMHSDDFDQMQETAKHIHRFYTHPERGEMRQQQFPMDMIMQNASLDTIEERYTSAMELLGLDILSPEQELAIYEAHKLGGEKKCLIMIKL